MRPSFCPDLTHVRSIEFRPFMLETAYDYYHTVKQSSHQRGMVQQTIGALAIEIVLKSFSARVSGNSGLLNECYELDRKALPGKPKDLHNLKYLSQVLRPDIRAYLLEEADEETVADYQDTFTKSRYSYERTAPEASTDEVLRLAAKLVCKTVHLYKQRGCIDPFIQGFDVDRVYFTEVQRILFVPQGEA
jgi:hypothetical protein